ncbi:MAG TPA: hypothetical protein VJT31_42510, partial [Rugosimonospora sp.]|nr:hypothetical protein [Rugosimonospora sp.]
MRDTRRRLLVTVAVAAMTVGLVVLERLDSALSAMHRADDLSSVYGSVRSPSALWSAALVQEHVQAWRAWDADRLAAGLASRVAGPYWVAVGYAAVHLILFATPLALLLWWLAGWTARRVQGRRGDAAPEDQSRVRALLRVAELARWAALGYLGGSLALDLAVSLAVRFGDPSPVVQAIGVLALLTDIALAGAVLPLLFADLATLDQAGRAWAGRRILDAGRRVVALRAQVAAAALLAVLVVALQGDIGLQVDDLAMRWLEYWPAGVLALVATGFAGWVLLMSGEVCWYRHARPRQAVRPIGRRTLVVLGAAGLVLIAAGLWLANGMDVAAGDVLIFPGSALLLFAGFSLPQDVGAVARVAAPGVPVAGA